jgi:hypothetical protein
MALWNGRETRKNKPADLECTPLIAAAC